MKLTKRWQIWDIKREIKMLESRVKFLKNLVLFLMEKEE